MRLREHSLHPGWRPSPRLADVPSTPSKFQTDHRWGRSNCISGRSPCECIVLLRSLGSSSNPSERVRDQRIPFSPSQRRGRQKTVRINLQDSRRMSQGLLENFYRPLWVGLKYSPILPRTMWGMSSFRLTVKIVMFLLFSTAFSNLAA
jgi:hypothetical protein